MKIEDKVNELISGSLKEEKIIIDRISYIKEEGNYFLRIVIDKEPYVDIDDCVKVSKIINPILDEANIIRESYILDVCSKEKGGSK